MRYHNEPYSNLLPPIYEYFGGNPIELIDLSQDIPKLMEYIQAFDNGTIETIESGEPTHEFGYYGEQLNKFIMLHPNFDTCLIPNQELQRVLSGMYSEKNLRERKEKKDYIKRIKNSW
jgi:hypothetical protein